MGTAVGNHVKNNMSHSPWRVVLPGIKKTYHWNPQIHSNLLANSQSWCGSMIWTWTATDFLLSQLKTCNFHVVPRCCKPPYYFGLSPSEIIVILLPWVFSCLRTAFLPVQPRSTMNDKNPFQPNSGCLSNFIKGPRTAIFFATTHEPFLDVLCSLLSSAASSPWMTHQDISCCLQSVRHLRSALQAEMFSPLTQSENGNENTQVWDGVGWFRVRKLEGEETRIHLRCQLKNMFVPACNNHHFGTCGSLPGLFSNYTAKWLGSWSICSMQSGVREFIRRTSQNELLRASMHKKVHPFPAPGIWKLSQWGSVRTLWLNMNRRLATGLSR